VEDCAAGMFITTGNAAKTNVSASGILMANYSDRGAAWSFSF
jgi:hypothetical protein